MIFGYSTSRPLDDILDHGLTSGGFLWAIDHMLGERFATSAALSLGDIGWIQDIVRRTIIESFVVGVPRPAVEVHWAPKREPDRCRVHFAFP